MYRQVAEAQEAEQADEQRLALQSLAVAVLDQQRQQLDGYRVQARDAGGAERLRADARALADAALLALVACLGLAQMSHETSPDLARLAMVSAVLMAASRLALPVTRHPWRTVALWGASTLGLVFRGAP